MMKSFNILESKFYTASYFCKCYDKIANISESESKIYRTNAKYLLAF